MRQDARVSSSTVQVTVVDASKLANSTPVFFFRDLYPSLLSCAVDVRALRGDEQSRGKDWGQRLDRRDRAQGREPSH